MLDRVPATPTIAQQRGLLWEKHTHTGCHGLFEQLNFSGVQTQVSS